jgi:kynureninase
MRQPADAIRRFVCGTPQILSLACLQESLTIFADVDMREVRAKSLGLTSLFMELVERECAGHGLEIVTPRMAGQRGNHVSIACVNSYRLIRALADRGVLGDFRAPELMRFGFTPLYCSFVDDSRGPDFETGPGRRLWREEDRDDLEVTCGRYPH